MIGTLFKATVGELKSFRGLCFLFVCLTFISAVLETVSIGLILPLLQSLTSEGEGSVVIGYIGAFLDEPSDALIAVTIAAFLLIATIISELASISKAAYASVLGTSIRNRMRERIVGNLFDYEESSLLKTSTGELTEIAISQTARSSKFIRHTLELGTDLMLAACIICLSMSISFEFTVYLVFFFGTLQLISWRLISAPTRVLGQKMTKTSVSVSRSLMEMLRGVRQLKFLGAGCQFQDYFSSLITLQQKIIRSHIIISSLPRALNNTVFSSLFVVGSAYLYFNQPIDFTDILPEVGVFMVVGQKMKGLATSISSRFVAIRLSYPAFVLTTETIASMKTGGLQKVGRPFSGSFNKILFNRVQFSYVPETPVLSDFCLHLERSEILSIVGPSGAGKSTIADLLLRIISPDKGVIHVDDVDLADIDLSDWRASIGYLSQTSYLFDMSTRENIRIGAPDASDAEVEQAARLANAHKFIEALPAGYDSVIRDGGINLSGGQRQRIALAQVMLRNPALLILDEPTSAQDIDTRRYIAETILEYRKNGGTAIIISHDPDLSKISGRTIHLTANTMGEIPAITGT